MPADFDQLCRQLREFAEERYPSFRSAEFRVVLAGGAELVVPVGGAGDVILTPARASAGQAPDVPRRTPEMVQSILQALAEAPEPVTGERLAELSGYSYGGSFREALAQLVRGGSVRNDRPGYRLATPPPAA